MEIDYIKQHKKRLSWMPWLFYSLKPKHLEWAIPWQSELQALLVELETIKIGDKCFIAPEANLFAEPGRSILIGDGVCIAANVFIHGPVSIGNNVSLNANVHIDGGAGGVVIGDDTRVAAGCRIFAFDHGISPDRLIREQPTVSHGVQIGRDVWIGANVCITDGVTIGDGAIIGMGAVVTKNIMPGIVAAGVPAKPIGDRRTWKQTPNGERSV